MSRLEELKLPESLFGVCPEATASNETDTQLSSSTLVPDASSQGQQDTTSNEDLQSSEAEKLFDQGILLIDCGFYYKAAILFQNAIDRDHNPSRAQLASMLKEGRPGLPKDRKRAHELASTGANLGCVHCKGWLAYDLVFGLDPEVSQIGMILAEESAKAGSCFGQLVVGLNFLRKKNSLAKDYLMLASTSGSVDALYRLGLMYKEGNLTFSDGSHCYRDLRTAFSYFSKAAKKGHIIAMIIVANWYEQGIGGAKVDIPKALSLLREIASSSNRYYPGVHDKIVELSPDIEEIKAIFKLMNPVPHVGYHLEKWINSVVRQYAVILYQILADKGHLNSQVWIVEEALKRKDYQRAAEYLRLAADQGHADSICKLADLILHGSGVAKDPCEAVRLYRVAAEKGHQQAQLNLSYVLGEGIGVQRDEEERIKWLVACAEQGNGQAKFVLKCIEEQKQKTAKTLQKK
jgi:TPR repeat protein